MHVMVLSVELKYSKLGTVHWILDLDSGTTAQKTFETENHGEFCGRTWVGIVTETIAFGLWRKKGATAVVVVRIGTDKSGLHAGCLSSVNLTWNRIFSFTRTQRLAL
jgi:hypothetical protein